MSPWRPRSRCFPPEASCHRARWALWGDAVNTAGRMQTDGTPGRIQITHATYDLLKDEFVCEPRGTVLIKGKGEMETWYLVGRREAVPA
ncbi:MAG: adenylate/guanylate cyclase domain-containing protein [Candidatus Limnocylindria bacterium]